LARPARGVLQIPASLVFRILRIWAQGTGQAIRASSHHLVLSNTLLDPLFKRADGIERIHAGPAATVTHSRDHKQPHPVALILSHLFEDRLVVPDGGFRCDARSEEP